MKFEDLLSGATAIVRRCIGVWSEREMAGG